jgi:hypothetical protein
MLALSQQHRGRLAEAEESYPRALELEHAETLANFGVLLLLRNCTDEAIACFECAIAHDPACAEAHCNLGVALLNRNRLAAAIASCDRAVALKPKFVDAAWNRALALLAAGDLEQGWAGYEGRRQNPLHKPKDFPRPLWRGEDIAGKTILLHHEQGLGDTIQFLRYVPLLAGRGARVVVEVPQALAGLAATVEGAAEIVGGGMTQPDVDVHCPLASLPERFSTRLDTIPQQSRTSAPIRWRRRAGGRSLATRRGARSALSGPAARATRTTGSGRSGSKRCRC